MEASFLTRDTALAVINAIPDVQQGEAAILQVEARAARRT